MKRCDISFNNQMRLFRKKYEQIYLKRDMAAYWNSYQKQRFVESYYKVYKSCKNRKSKWVILKDLIYLRFKWGCRPFHYYRYSLFDKKYSRQDIKNYLPETVFYYDILPKINEDYCLLDNKNVTYDILKANNIPIPQCILKIIDGNIFDEKSNIIEDDIALNRVLMSYDGDAIVAKFANCGSGGKQIKILKKVGNGFSIDGQILSCDYLKANFNNWLLQEKLINSSVLSNIHPNSLNSFRIITYTHCDEVKVLYMMLKLGNNGAETDNAHTNGIYIKVNIDNNETEGLAYDENQKAYAEHPYTGANFIGIKFDNLNEIIAIAVKCAKLFPQLKFIGWDIALTNKGVVVLEGNSSPGLTIIQRTHNGMSDFINLYYGN